MYAWGHMSIVCIVIRKYQIGHEIVLIVCIVIGLKKGSSVRVVCCAGAC